MNDIGTVGLLIILANFAISYKGFTNNAFMDGYKFEVDRILMDKDYMRLISSGFLHVNWQHLIFNMLALYSFSGLLEAQLGEWKYLLIYFASLIGGDLLSLYIHRHHGDYSAVGASGAICGLIFASIALFPGMEIGFMFLPFSMPSWLFGLLYVAYSIYGIKSKSDNIGHDAHLGGGLIGMLIAIACEPNALQINYLPIFAILVPSIIFIFVILTKPHVLLIDSFFFNQHNKSYTIDDKYNGAKADKQTELNTLLDKIRKKGMNSLSVKEKERLDQLSK
jgi:membrane associated rhomboid family serine protease